MKMRIMIVTMCMLFLWSCTDGPTPEKFLTPPLYERAVLYNTVKGWSPVNGTEINVSSLPSEFTLEFKSFGIEKVAAKALDGSNIEIEILDTIERDFETSEILNKPVEVSHRHNNPVNLYLQGIKLTANGEKSIELVLTVRDYGKNYNHICNLVRK